jgi:hypothetical protein
MGCVAKYLQPQTKNTQNPQPTSPNSYHRPMTPQIAQTILNLGLVMLTMTIALEMWYSWKDRFDKLLHGYNPIMLMWMKMFSVGLLVIGLASLVQ